MESACTLCYDLVLHHKPHTALTKISALEDSELYKCRCCSAYLHKHHGIWEIISSGHYTDIPQEQASSSTQSRLQRSENTPIDQKQCTRQYY